MVRRRSFRSRGQLVKFGEEGSGGKKEMDSQRVRQELWL